MKTDQTVVLVNVIEIRILLGKRDLLDLRFDVRPVEQDLQRTHLALGLEGRADAVGLSLVRTVADEESPSSGRILAPGRNF